VSALAWVVGVGARAPGGLDARQVALSTRAGRLQPRSTSVVDRSGARIGVWRCRAIADAVVGQDRLLALAAPALREALRDAGLAGARVSLVVSASDGALGGAPHDHPAFLTALARAADATVDLASSQVLRSGHAGFAAALDIAASQVARTGAAPVVALGVDSYFDPALLAALDESRRLLGGHASDGILPAEGAAAAVLVAPRTKGARCLASLRAVAVEHEPAATEDDAHVGEAMTEVCERLLASAPDGPVPWLVHDVTCERHRVKEWSFVSHRHRTRLDPTATRLLHFYDEMGDLGGATGALALAHVVWAFRMRFAPATVAMILTHSDGPTRGGMVVEDGS
jgi:3-oxoacyl-[acyl-carrier-protein] synthase-1